jgi:hypothetical protein
VQAQIEQIKKRFSRTKPIYLRNFTNPAEFSCFGFNITDIDVRFNDNYFQVDANYIEVPEPKSFVCEKLTSSLSGSPDKVLETLRSVIAPHLKNTMKNAFEK